MQRADACRLGKSLEGCAVREGGQASENDPIWNPLEMRVAAGHIMTMKSDKSGSYLSKKELLGRSAKTGVFVLRPVSKRDNITVREANTAAKIVGLAHKKK